MNQVLLEGTVHGVECKLSKTGKEFYTILIKNKGVKDVDECIPVQYFGSGDKMCMVGESVIVVGKLKGSTYNGKHYLSLNSSEIVVREPSIPSNSFNTYHKEERPWPYNTMPAKPIKVGDGDDDCPF